MRVQINIATRPPDSSGPLRRGAMALGCLVLILGFVVVRAELRSRSEFRNLVEQTSQLETDIQNLRNTQREMQDWLETPQVTQIRDRSALLNALIGQKSLSWTRMFQDLEGTLPGGVRITAIVPDSAGGNGDQAQPDLRLAVAAKDIVPVVSFIKRLEDSPRFDNPVVSDQRYPAEGEEDGEIKVTLTARYVQALSEAAVEAAPDQEAEAEEVADEDAVSKPKAWNSPAGDGSGVVAAGRQLPGGPGGRR